MTIDVQHRSGTAIVRPAGRLTGGPDEELMNAVRPLIEQHGARVVLDLSGVDFISSSGLGDLVRLSAQANTQGARIVITQPTPFVAGVFKTTRLDRFFDTAPDIDAAIRALGDGAA